MPGSEFPFSALVGQDELRLALVLNAIDPLIGGVAVMGARGTGKSTAVRALAQLLPPILAVADCPYRCPPDSAEAQCDPCRR
ncbi:MAG TPA: magnesium chelatase ATPase subunit I, partial [Limnochordia bacterium]